MFKLPSVDYSFQIVKSVVLKYLELNDDVIEDPELMDKCLNVLTCFVNINNVISTLSTAAMTKIKDDCE